MKSSGSSRMRVGAGTILAALLFAAPPGAQAQTVEDGSDKVIGEADARVVLDLIRRHLNRPEAKVTVLRRSEGATICGSVNVKNRDGMYIGERGFVADLAAGTFGRVPEGPELLRSHRSEGFAEMERIRALYFRLCLD